MLFLCICRLLTKPQRDDKDKTLKISKIIDFTRIRISTSLIGFLVIFVSVYSRLFIELGVIW